MTTTSVEELQALERENLNGNGNDGHASNGHDPGLSIEEMAERDADELFEEEADTTEYVEGTTGQLSLSVGGRKPDSGTMRMGAKEVPLAEKSQFPKGSTVKLHVLASVDEVKFRDKKDAAGEVTHTTRVHLAVPLSVKRMAPKEALEAAVIDFLYEVESEDVEAAARAVVEQAIVHVQEDRKEQG